MSDKLIKVRRNYDKEVVFFRFFASKEIPGHFWFTETTESFGFELGRMLNYTPLRTTWEKIKNEN